MSRPPVDRAQVLAALAQDLDLPGVMRRFGLSREEMAHLLQEAASVLRLKAPGAWSLYVDGACRGNPGPGGPGPFFSTPAGRGRQQRAVIWGKPPITWRSTRPSFWGWSWPRTWGSEISRSLPILSWWCSNSRAPTGSKPPTSSLSGGKHTRRCKSLTTMLFPTWTGRSTTRPTVWPARPLTGTGEKGNI